jgi:hypothetical protein
MPLILLVASSDRMFATLDRKYRRSMRGCPNPRHYSASCPIRNFSPNLPRIPESLPPHSLPRPPSQGIGQQSRTSSRQSLLLPSNREHHKVIPVYQNSNLFHSICHEAQRMCDVKSETSIIFPCIPVYEPCFIARSVPDFSNICNGHV